MAIVRFNPFSYQSLFRPLLTEGQETWPELTVTEGLNVFEEDNKVVVEASVPGVGADKIDITYEDGVLHISGQVEEKEVEKEKKRIVHQRQRVASFKYTTMLPRPIDQKSIEAKVENGVVTITAAVAEAAKPKKIPVKVASK
jgi:HSP20 family protein